MSEDQAGGSAGAAGADGSEPREVGPRLFADQGVLKVDRSRPTVVSSTPMRELDAQVLAREAAGLKLGKVTAVRDDGGCTVELEPGALDLIVGMFGAASMLIDPGAVDGDAGDSEPSIGFPV